MKILDFQISAVDWANVFVEGRKVVIGHGMAELKILKVSPEKLSLKLFKVVLFIQQVMFTFLQLEMKENLES